MQKKFTILRIVLVCLGLLLLPVSRVCAQGGQSTPEPDNNWSETIGNGYRVLFDTVPATCYHNGYLKYAIADSTGHILADASALSAAGFDEAMLYYKALTLDTSRHFSGHPYHGGWDSIMVEYGDYVVGLEATFDMLTIDSEIDNAHRYERIDTNVAKHIPTTYVELDPSAILSQAWNPGDLGRLPSLECLNTGRIQLKIENGRFPYIVSVVRHNTTDTLRVDTFYTNQHSGNDVWKEDYKDYYTFDSMPPGDWDFYVLDGCNVGGYRKGQTVSVIDLPRLDRIEIYASSGSPLMVDSNVVKINSVLKLPYPNYFHRLLPNMWYKLHLEGEESDWLHYPDNGTLSGNFIKTVLYDTIDLDRYCDFWTQNIVYEYKFEMPDCDTIVQRDTFHYYKPNPDYFVTQSEFVTTGETVLECGHITESYRSLYSINYESFLPNHVSSGDDDIYRRYHFTHPIQWVYLSQSGDTIKKEPVEDISKLSAIYATDFQNMTIAFDTLVTRRLVDAHGCVLYDSTSRLFFNRRTQESSPGWAYQVDAPGGHCCETPRTIRIYEENSGAASPDGTTIELYSSPSQSGLNNFYNFTATYDASAGQWTVHKLFHVRNKAQFSVVSDGRSLTMSDNCLPGGPYLFVIKTPCDTVYLNAYVQFPAIYSAEVIEEPRFEMDTLCSDMYLRFTEGNIVRHSISQNPYTGDESDATTPLTVYFEIVDGPVGGYDREAHTRYAIGDMVRIAMSGTYVIKSYPYDPNQNLCEPMAFYDTVAYTGFFLGYDFSMALLCDTTDRYGNAYVRAKAGMPPYRYELYSEADLGGTLVMAKDNVQRDSVFVVPKDTFQAKGIEMSPNQPLSCRVIDACGGFYYVNFNPMSLASLQKTWFEDGFTAHTSCEGTYIHLYALQVGDLFRYLWTGPGGFSDTTADPTFFIPREAPSGYYKVVIMGTGCDEDEITDSLYLEVLPSPSVTLEGAGVVCPGEDAELTFRPLQGDSLSSDQKEVTFTIAFENANGIEYRQFTARSGDEVQFTYTVRTNTKVYPVEVSEEDGCGYQYLLDGDTILLTVRTDMMNPCQLSTWHDTVCYGGDATLLALTDGTSTPSPANPYYINWYADYDQQHLLFADTITSLLDTSRYDTLSIIQRTFLYLSLGREGVCPTANGAVTGTLNMENDTVLLACDEQIRYFDPGGPDSDYPQRTEYQQIFISPDHRPLYIHFDSLNLSPTSILFIISGSRLLEDSVVATLQSGSLFDEIIFTRSDTMTLFFMPFAQAAYGWSAVVGVAPGIAIADVYQKRSVTLHDEICRTSDPYTPPFDGLDFIDPTILNEKAGIPGSYTFTHTFSDGNGCDSVVVFTLDVIDPPVRSDSTVIITNYSGGYTWNGHTYTETGQYTYSVPGTSAETGCDSLDRINLIVLEVTVNEAEICEGEDTMLTITVETPELEHNFEVHPEVGDVVCLKTVDAGGGSSFTETLILRPATFLERASDEPLEPVGVVFYVDPTNDHLGKAIALTDAWPEQVDFSVNDNDINDANSDNNSIYGANNDLKGALNTTSLLKSSYLKYHSEEYAYAAYYCAYYNHETQSVRPTKDVLNWYLPAAGEVSLYYAERTTVNYTLEILNHFFEGQGSTQTATVPLQGITEDTGLWTSSVWTDKVIHINQKGQARDHARNRKKYVRAVFSYEV